MVQKGKETTTFIADVKFNAMHISDDIMPSTGEREDGDCKLQRSLVREDSGSEELCGMGSWRPACFQKLANRRIYALAFATVIIVQGMTYSYFYGVLTTVEKTFGIQSRTFGFILSGNDISQILCGVLVTYIAGRGSRPFWLAIGLLVTSCSCLLYASAQLFWNGDAAHTLFGHSHLNDSGHVLCSNEQDASLPAEQLLNCENASSTSSGTPALVIFFIGQVVSGMGSMAIFSLGFTYMDDNVKMSASPLYMTLTTGLRYLGPTLGYSLASVCLKIYIRPSEIPDYDQKNPRWLGAWWLGFIIVGLTQMIIAVPVILFPKQLPSTHGRIMSSVSDDNFSKQEPEKEIGNNMPSIKDFFKAIRRILRNPIVVLELLSAGPLLLGIVGFSTFLPKYLESNFGKTPAQATVFTGVSGMCMMMVGSLLGGFTVWKFKPRAVSVCIWCLIVDIIYVSGIFTIMNFRCNSVSFVGADFSNGEAKITSQCAQQCQCTSKFEPVCMGSQQYLSPCFAGCKDFDTREDGHKIFFNCTCGMTPFLNGTTEDFNLTMQNAETGYCPGTRDCIYFWPYITILGIVKMMAATARVGGLLVFIRSVDKRDKSITISLMGTAASLLGFIPGPIIYGAVVDSTCLLWEKSACGSKKNCWLYNLDDFRHWFHGITMACFTFAIVFDVIIAMYARKMNLYSENPPSRVLGFKEGLKCDTESQTLTEKLTKEQEGS